MSSPASFENIPGQPDRESVIALLRTSGMFDPDYYLRSYPDVAAAGFDPLVHFVDWGASEGRDPSAFFSTRSYMAAHPELAISGGNPLFHHVLAHAQLTNAAANPPIERRPVLAAEEALTLGEVEAIIQASGLFDANWYLRSYLDVADSGLDPLFHYARGGGLEGRFPNPNFDGAWYIQQHPEILTRGMHPLVHYIRFGQPEGLPTKPPADELDPAVAAAVRRYKAVDDIDAATLLELSSKDMRNHLQYFLPNRPINAHVDARLNARPAVNILLPSVQKRSATGGPNTVYVLGMLLAQAGISVNFMSTDMPLDADTSGIKDHIHRLSGVDPVDYNVGFLDVSDRTVSVPIGYNDVFLATAWWTAQMARSAAKLTRNSRIYYMIQDYETLFYGASENFADAESTYGFDHFPIINTSLLRDHLAERGVGRYVDPAFSEAAAVFEPAVDKTHFFPEEHDGRTERTLLFYARPTIARRNLFGLGVASLRAAVQAGLFDRGKWKFIGMGESFDPVPLGKGHELVPAIWLDFNAYAAQMRSADLLLSLMLSPHPSYPPLEMAASGGVTVTSVFGSKTRERLSALSPGIIGVPPRIEDMVRGLSRAIALSDDTSQQAARAAAVNLPRTWVESLSAVLPRLLRELKADGLDVSRPRVRLPAPVSFVHADEMIEDSLDVYVERALARRQLYRASEGSARLSLVTTVYDTDPSFVADLAHTVFGQDTGQPFEWLILDNGSSAPGTLKVLEELKRHPFVRLERVEENLGIVGGMRWCLENASGDYVLPLDSDDLLFPDALRVVGAALDQAGQPAIAYTDEDKTDGEKHSGPYFKPDWDPVLFMHSCYIAHLTAIKRKVALELGCYLDPRTDGSHDWDSFTRFLVAGHVPLHIPELLYSWRLHAASTSGNFRSKPYIFGSHVAVLEKFLAGRERLDRYEVVPSPLFNGAPDWRFGRRAIEPGRGREATAPSDAKVKRLALPPHVARDWLAAELKSLGASDYVALIADGCTPGGSLAEEEAETLFDLFPDTAIVGGRIHDGRAILEAGYVFGYRGGIGCPDSGRPLNDVGYFAQMWKPHSVAAVSARYCFVERGFLENAVSMLPEVLPVGALGPWLGGLARRSKRRVVYTPYVEARSVAINAFRREDLPLFNATFGDLATTCRVGYPESLDRGGRAPYTPAHTPARLALMTYKDYLDGRMRVRSLPAAKIPAGNTAGISLLTTVYAKTDPELFRQTAEAVRWQSVAPTEWLVLAHGPIPIELERLIEQFAKEGLLTSLKQKTNLGIHGGLRYCLERAKGEFALSLDADDLLTPDAVALLSKAAGENKIDILYTDEDLLIADEPRHPYHRPDFDPVLLKAHSYVWHAIVFRTKLALKLGVYSSAASEYAQDWDTLLRFDLAGHEAFHLPEVVYHWRQHDRSLSHSGTINQGTLSSVQSVLGMVIEKAGTPAHFEVSRYPLDVGAPDFYIKRKPIDAPPIQLVRLGKADQEPITERFPFASTAELTAKRGPEGMRQLERVVKNSDAPFVVLLGSGLLEPEASSFWQALRHFELVKTCVAVGGPLVDQDRRILFGAGVLLNERTFADPLAGLSAGDPGPFSLAFKPHCVAALSIDLMMVRRDFLLEALRTAPEGLALRSLGLWLGLVAQNQKARLVYEPLLRGDVIQRSTLIQDGIEGLNRTWTHLLEAESADSDAHVVSGNRPPMLGLASFALHSMRHGG